MGLFVTVLGMGLVTYLTRLSLIIALGRLEVSWLLQRALKYVPPAVLSAIIFPELLRPERNPISIAGNERLLAGILAALVAWRTSNVLLTIGAGMVALWLLQFLA